MHARDGVRVRPLAGARGYGLGKSKIEIPKSKIFLGLLLGALELLVPVFLRLLERLQALAEFAKADALAREIVAARRAR